MHLSPVSSGSWPRLSIISHDLRVILDEFLCSAVSFRHPHHPSPMCNHPRPCHNLPLHLPLPHLLSLSGRRIRLSHWSSIRHPDLLVHQSDQHSGGFDRAVRQGHLVDE